MSHALSATSVLDSLRSSRAAEAILDEHEWSVDHWDEALAACEPIPSVRVLSLPAMPWTRATLTRFATVLPDVDSLTIRWRGAADVARLTLREAIAPWWGTKLTALVCDFVHAWGAEDSVAEAPAFASTLTVFRARHLRHDECVKALRAFGSLSRLVELDAGRIGDTRALFEHLPAIRSFSCEVDAKFGLDVSFESETIESLAIAVHPRPATSSLRVRGAVASLRRLTLLHSKEGGLDLDSLGALASSARLPLESAQIEAADAWRIAALLGAAVHDRHGAGPARMTIRRTAPSDPSSQEASVARAEDFVRLRSLRAMGTEIEPTSWLALLDRDSHLDALAREVAAVEELDLNGDVHAFLLRDPERFAAFERARSLCFFDAHALTSDGLEALLRAMPSLAHLRLVNNHNPAMMHLRARSASLESLVLTHFHQLRTWEIEAPKLELLELDNCDANSDGELDRRFHVGDGIIYGNFSERLCAAILDGAPDAKLPALREFTLWNNPYAVGPLLAVESMRVDIRCAQGHPTLERLTLANVTHVRSLSLKRVPKLRFVAVSQYDDEGVGTTWLERVDLDGVPEGCAIELCSITPSRVGLGGS